MIVPMLPAKQAPDHETRRNRTREERIALVAQAVGEHGANVPTSLKKALATRHALSVRTIERAISDALGPEPEPRCYELSNELLIRIAMHHGELAPAYREMRDEQDAGIQDWGLPSYPTVARALAAEPWIRPVLKKGPQALDPFLQVGVYEAPFPNAISMGDETKVPISCMSGRTRIDDLRLFANMDDYSRAITAHSVYVGAITGDLTASTYLAACIGRELSVTDLRAHGIDADGPVLLGGVPDLHTLDNARANLGEAVAGAVMVAGSTLHYARPHIAADKGKLERSFRTLKGKLAAIPGWTKGAQSHPDDGHPSRPFAVPADDDLPKLEAVVGMIDAVIEDYNWNHVNSSTGSTPIARWVEGLKR